ncbi:hypothetical protein GC093_20000 [Paenibacillus sp. LMG 31456]|uniref:Uncharacterized protein n=1 Tax=Paenibacillus foliorum TaxID=2654974 RepID=A0A972GXB0_9BACL|nr:hypothetical protein [Paenibacillus foliorum]NOU95492.1 hypothetical protein [Paenibacillus foliorum]
MRNNFYIKLLLIVLGMGFCIFFGVDLATRGVERIQGPIVKAAPESSGVRLWPQAEKPQEAKMASGAAAQNGSKLGGTATRAQEAEAKAKKEAKEEVEPKAEINETSGISRLGNKAGELLQIVAYHGIRLFVSLFEMITG